MIRIIDTSDGDVEHRMTLESGIELLMGLPIDELVCVVEASQTPLKRKAPPPPWKSKYSKEALDALEVDDNPVNIETELRQFDEIPCVRAHVLENIALIARKDNPLCDIPVLITDMENRRQSSTHVVQYLRGTLIGVENMRLFDNECDVVFSTKHVKQLVGRQDTGSFFRKVSFKMRSIQVGLQE